MSKTIYMGLFIRAGEASSVVLTHGDRLACLHEVQKYRPDIVLCADEYSDMADQQAQNDGVYGAHNYLQRFGWSGTCAGFSPGQCECPNWGSEQWAKCTKAYYDEGPGGGHYEIMMNPNAKCVACGYNAGTMTHNFCANDSIGPSPSFTPTPAPSPSFCQDVEANCQYFVNQGYCATSNEYYQWMTQKCPRACGFCSPTPAPSQTPMPSPVPIPTPAPSSSTCEDTETNCQYFVSQDYCSPSSEYYQWMRQRCSHACGFCGSPTPTPTSTPTLCVDDNANCGYFVGQGYCQRGNTYYPYMTTTCPKACGFCHGAELDTSDAIVQPPTLLV